MNYLNEIEIDDTALDVEWFEQPKLATKWGRILNEAEDELARAEENVKVVRSELILRINQNPEKYLGVGVKPSDPKVEAAYRKHPKHKKAKERWLKALKKKNDIEIAAREIRYTRKQALENAVQLYLGNYFAGPKVPRNLNKEIKNWKQKKKEEKEERQELYKRVKIKRKKG